ncbi:hypothetical protein ON010_g572 [Phytophthora cinnamomi]|nr:hypothetical protein ON010_g572 [Phytophthora cinnamomi]
MSDTIDAAARAKAKVPAPASHKRIGMVGETEDKVAAVAAKDDGETNSPDGETELLVLMHGITEWLDRLEESQAKLEKTLEGDRAKCESKVDPILTPPWTRRIAMHANHDIASEAAAGAPRLYAAAQAQAQQPPPTASQHQAAAAQPGVGQQPFRYPDARQKKLVIRAFNGKELGTCPVRLRVPVAGGREGRLAGELPVRHDRAILQQAGLVVADANVAVRDGEDVGDLQDEHHACSSDEAVHGA